MISLDLLKLVGKITSENRKLIKLTLSTVSISNDNFVLRVILAWIFSINVSLERFSYTNIHLSFTWYFRWFCELSRVLHDLAWQQSLTNKSCHAHVD